MNARLRPGSRTGVGVARGALSALDLHTASAAEAELQVPARASSGATLRAYYQLTKPNLSALVMITGVLGYFLRAPMIEADRLVHLIIGLWCTSGGAGALNMVIEGQRDRLMQRTRVRPIPSGQLTSRQALVFSLSLFTFGFVELLLFTHWVTAVLALATLVLYAAIYTPLKSTGPLAVAIGAIPGAIPPVMGWAAIDGSMGAPAWILFALLFAWQFPHFLALAWMYREDYARGGFDFLPRGDREPTEEAKQRLGRRTGLRMLIGAGLLLPVTWSLILTGQAHALYAVGSTLLGLWFLGRAARMEREPGMASARACFFGSIIYLPLLLAVIVLDRLVFGL